jgi:hypothetical protein
MPAGASASGLSASQAVPSGARECGVDFPPEHAAPAQPGRTELVLGTAAAQSFSVTGDRAGGCSRNPSTIPSNTAPSGRSNREGASRSGAGALPGTDHERVTDAPPRNGNRRGIQRAPPADADESSHQMQLIGADRR